MIPKLPLAEFSADAGGEDKKGNYRFTLWRHLAPGFEIEGSPKHPNDYVQFVGLNPSKATETANDNTITRCIGFATGWGYGALLMTNIFAWRDKKPEIMKKQKDPEGDPLNLDRIVALAEGASMIVVAWGSHGKFHYRERTVRDALKPFEAKVRCFGISMQGHPIHPIYMPKDQPLIPYPL